jgi:hypothetical protein
LVVAFLIISKCFSNLEEKKFLYQYFLIAFIVSIKEKLCLVLADFQSTELLVLLIDSLKQR